jgi:glycosyltransferase involved in cell wall biosynthesis
MLSYERGAMKSYGLSRDRLRLLVILLIQNRALTHADGVIFLTKYAARVIQQSCGSLSSSVIIHHGVDDEFRIPQASASWPGADEGPIKCIYVSNVDMYKHHWVVVKAIEQLRKDGHNLHLTLVGSGSGKAQRLTDQQIALSDPDNNFVSRMGFVRHGELPALMEGSDVFVFASSCENMPVTLVEAMAVGLPIACSNRGPMPEILSDGGVFCDPEDSSSMAAAIEKIITDPELRERIARRAHSLSQQYSWSRCSVETWAYISEAYERFRSG